MKIDGQCHCGAIAYEAELDPEKVAICSCTDCQSLSASAFRTLGVVSGGDFKLTKGVPKIYRKTGDSGNVRRQVFCGDCGSAIYASDDSDTPPAYNVRLGTARQRNELVPKKIVWAQSEVPWLNELAGIPRVEKV